MTVPWIITDEDPWMPDGRYDGPGQLMLVSPSGRGHLAFHEGVSDEATATPQRWGSLFERVRVR